MEQTVYNRRAWRELPRETCLVSEMFGYVVGPCRGLIHRHHVRPGDPDSPSIQVCASHHPTLERVIRLLSRERPRRRCSHNHRYDHARRECEARLNGD